MNADEWREIRELHAKGATIKGIAESLGMSRNTVRRALAYDEPPTDHRPRKGSVADAFEPAIRTLLAEDPDISIADIHRAIGWDRSRNTLAKLVRHIRSESSNQPPEVALYPQYGSSIPTFSTGFVGRDGELFALRRLLGTTRLITITGPGGIGKTRLAVQTATDFRRAFADGVRFIELASLKTSGLLAQEVLDGLGIGQPDLPGRPLEEVLVHYLRHKQMLIILDNCEHIVDSCADLVAYLLRHTTQVSIIATSRERLAVAAEHVFTLAPLSTTRSDDSGSVGAALQLFESRAAAVLAGFSITDRNRDTVRRICSQLDGIPLSIELACARLSVLSVQDLEQRLDRRLELLTTGNRSGPERHRTLQATVDWSYELCTSAQQKLWARLSVFVDEFDLPMAEQVCSDDELPAQLILDGISALVGKSLLQREQRGDSARFRMLETIREYGAGKLSPTEADALQLRHLESCSTLVRSSVESWASSGQQRAGELLRSNRANLRKALHTALSAGSDKMLSTATELVSTAWFLWSSGFSVREHRMWLMRIAERDTAPTARRGRLLATLGLVQTMQGDRSAASEVLDESIRLASACGDDATIAFATQTKGLKDYLDGDFESAEPLFKDALNRYEELPENIDLLWALHIEMGMFYCSTLDTVRALEHFEFVRAHSELAGERWMLSYAVYGLGLAALADERYDEALRRAMESLALKREFLDDVVGTSLVTDLLSWAEAAAGSKERSAVLLGAASRMWESFGMQLYGSRHWVERRAEFESTARTGLGDERFAQCRRRGAEMSIPEMVRFALKEEVPIEHRSSGSSAAALLSPRELEVARLIADGLSNKEIAARMVLSPRTVEGHVVRILRKLGMTGRHQVATAFVGNAHVVG
ncbi:LuxR C-terminal-related transcriptional regulator [Rhodococcus oxybenzonivorans]|uniref:LuxR C-terminal-related transcriptional regulator n=1 Tax=Rhodococcus oxybenzonivorans TaxID=1990687 RepID=UPI0029557A3A|nr:LuxR C-terminal-related transcriptional regulator [Rhodococcus oxybenzonivorans]MDV7353251.1 LuxR C-terminal-related transcriptional regulator [Rhodococcus oxybenzonivorans]